MKSAHDENISLCPASAGSARRGQYSKSNRFAQGSRTIRVNVIFSRSTCSATLACVIQDRCWECSTQQLEGRFNKCRRHGWVRRDFVSCASVRLSSLTSELLHDVCEERCRAVFEDKSDVEGNRRMSRYRSRYFCLAVLGAPFRVETVVPLPMAPLDHMESTILVGLFE